MRAGPHYAAAMTTRKQREREQRFRRHGVDRPESPQRDQAAHRAEEPAAKGKGRQKGRSRATAARKPTAYPTLRRSLVRAPFFGLMWFVISRFMMSGSGNTVEHDALTTLLLTAAMVPLLYLADKLTYALARRKGLPVQDPPAGGWLGFGG